MHIYYSGDRGKSMGMQVGGTVYSSGDDVILTLQLKWEGGTQ